MHGGGAGGQGPGYRHGRDAKRRDAREKAAFTQSRDLLLEAVRRAEVPDAYATEPSAAPDAVDPAPVNDVILTMVKRFGVESRRAEEREANARRAAEPLIKAALDQQVLSGRRLGEMMGVADATISRIRKQGKASRLRELQLEEALERAAAEWRAAREARDVALAHRWQWIRIGHGVGLAQTDMAGAAGISRTQVSNDLKLGSEKRARAREFRELLASSRGAPPGEAVVAGSAEAIALRRALIAEIEGRPEDGDLHAAAAAYLRRIGDAAGAERLYVRGARIGHACCAHNLGIHAWRDGDRDAAERWLRKAASLEHTCDSAGALGQLLAEQGREAEAVEAWEAAVELGVAAAACRLARHYKGTGDDAAERSWWERTAGMDHGCGLRHVGYDLWHEGREEEAEAVYERAAELGDAQSACWLGRALIERDPLRSRRHLELASTGGHPCATEPLIGLLINMGRQARALSACLRLVEQGGTPPHVLYASLLESHGDGSSDTLERAQEQWLLSAEDGVSVGWMMAGLLAGRLGRREQARELLWQAVEEGSGDGPEANIAVRHLADLTYGRSNHAALEELAREALERGIPQVLMPVADILGGDAGSAAAIDLLERAREKTRDRTLKAELEAELLWQAVPKEHTNDYLLEGVHAEWFKLARRGSRRALRYLADDYLSDVDLTATAKALVTMLVDADEPYHRELAECHLRDGERERARAVLQAGVNAGEVDCYGLLGRLYREDGDLERAHALWDAGFAGGDWESGVFAGEAFIARGLFDEARSTLTKAAESGSTCALTVLGRLEYGKAKAKGIAHFRTAMNGGCHHGAIELADVLLADPAPSPKAMAEARRALRMAAEAGDYDSALRLAELTAGDGRPEILDSIEAAAGIDRRADAALARVRPRQGTGRFRSLVRKVRR